MCTFHRGHCLHRNTQAPSSTRTLITAAEPIDRPGSNHVDLTSCGVLQQPIEARTLIPAPSLPGEAPRLCRGGSRSLTFPAVVHRRSSRLVSHHAHEKEFRDGRLQEPKPQQVGVQISRGLHSQVPQEDAVWGIEAASRRGVPQIGHAEGVQGRRGAFDAGSCSHDDFDPTQICRR